jgi:trigger factor
MKELREYKDDKLELKVSQKPGCKVLFEVVLSPSECRKTREEAIRQTQRQATLPGFRKGRVPAALIEKQFESAIYDRWVQLAADLAFRLAARASSLFPWNIDESPQTEMRSPLTTEGASFSFEFEHLPAIPLVERNQLELPVAQPAVVTETDVEERLLAIREHRGSFKVVEKVIEEGDYVTIDVWSVDEEPHQQLLKEARIVAHKGKLPHWLYAALLGKTNGESTEVVTEPDEDSSEEARSQFKPRRVSVIVHAVERLELAKEEDLFSEFKVNSREELKQKLRAQLEREAKNDAELKQRQELWRMLLEQYSFELPFSMLETEKRRVIRVMVNHLLQTESRESVLRREDDIERMAAGEAEVGIKCFLLARRMVEEAKEEPTEHEVVTRSVQLLIADGLEGKEPAGGQAERSQRWQLYRSQALYDLFVRKAEDLLLRSEPTGTEGEPAS